MPYNVIAEDDQSVTVETEAGPVVVAKAGLSPEFSSQFVRPSTLDKANASLAELDPGLAEYANFKTPTKTVPMDTPVGQVDVPVSRGADLDVATQTLSQIDPGVAGVSQMPAPRPLAGPATASEQVVAPPQPKPAQAAPRGIQGPSGSPEINELAALEKSQIEVAKAQSEAQRLYDQQHLKLVEESQKRQQGIVEDYKAKLAENEAKVEALRKDILETKINPNRYWEANGGFNAVTGAIAMILGGIGAGIAKTQNYAMQAIEKAVDRDIEAQKLEMGKKETLLGEYVRQGHGIREAEKLAKAYQLDVFNAQLEAAALKWGDPMKKAALDAQINNIKGQNMQTRAAIYAKQASAKIEQEKLGLERARLGLEQQRIEAQKMAAMAKAGAKGDAADVAAGETKDALAQAERLVKETGFLTKLTSKVKDNDTKVKADYVREKLMDAASQEIYGVPLGKLKGDKISRLENLVPNLLQLDSGEVETALAQIRRGIQMEKRRAMSSTPSTTAETEVE